MAVDGVDVVTKTMLCFCELVAALFSELLLTKASVDRCRHLSTGFDSVDVGLKTM